MKAHHLLVASSLAFTTTTNAAVVASDNFGGAATALDGEAADVGGSWTAGANFLADGSGVSTTAGDDNSAYLPVPALQTGFVYTVTATLSALDNNFFYVGLASSAPTDVDERWHATQGNESINIEWRNIGATQDFSLHHQLSNTETRSGTTALTSTSPLSPSTLTLEIDASSGLSSSDITLFNGASTVGSTTLDLSNFDTSPVFGFGNEAGGGSWQLDSVSFSAVPEPSSLVLGGLGVIGLLLRRRA